MQTTSHILMIRPVNFAFNPETAESNAFQVKQMDADVQQRAVKEFDAFVTILKENGVDVTVIEDTPEPYTPDSIFPNNWVSFHEDGSLILYPMFATKRRLERKQQVLDAVKKKFSVTNTIDLTHYENNHLFLEGTGSMVLDRENTIAYACVSNRTSETVLKEFCNVTGYSAVVFMSVDEKGLPIYHTNVMMCVADKYVVICLSSIPDDDEKKMVMKSITGSGKEIIDISFEQLNHFAGNMLQVENKVGEKLLVMSTKAYYSLSAEQVAKLSAYNKIIHSSLITIETNGGGSARCMMAEIHLSVQETV
jgi:hypothetical protein